MRLKNLFKSLNVQFIFYFLLFSYIPLLIFSILGYQLNKHFISEIHESNLAGINTVTFERILDIFQEQSDLANIFCSGSRLNIKSDNQKKSRSFDPFMIVENGRIVHNHNIDPEIQPYLLKALENDRYSLVITPKKELYLRSITKSSLIVFLTLNKTEIQSRLKNTSDSGISHILISKPGHFFITADELGFINRSSGDEIVDLLVSMGMVSSRTSGFIVDTQLDQELILYSVKSDSGLFQDLEYFLSEIILANIFIGLLMFIIALFFSRRITNPIRSLVTAVHKISRGDMSQPITIRSNDEIKLLAEEFERMRQKLKESYTDLEDRIEERTQALRDAQFQISHQEKMASLGLLAAGVAHEIGNPLTSISSMAQIIKRKVKDQNFIEYLNTILKNIERIRKIVRELVDFARPSSYEAGDTDINELIRTAVGIVKYDRRAKSINIDLELDNNLPTLYLVADQLMQVFINILINAVDALTEDRNRILIRSSGKGSEIVLQFEDSGIGIEKDNLTKIFEPFFTTKKVGKGTGLGLSVSYGIIKNLNGKIEVKSQPGEGSVFTITLPRTFRRS